VIHASAHGVDSHGMRLLPWYADCLRSGLAKGAPDIKVTQAAGHGAGRCRWRHGPSGHVPCHGRGLRPRARTAASAWRRSSTRPISERREPIRWLRRNAGFIGLVTPIPAPSSCRMADHGRSTAPVPISLAAPNPGGEPFLLDMATSSIPWNKVLRYRTEGLELPQGVAVDARWGPLSPTPIWRWRWHLWADRTSGSRVRRSQVLPKCWAAC
jgi:ureidoglycolate dehydrogenase (NAD+)